MDDAEKDEIAHIRAGLASREAERTELGERLAALERTRETFIRVDHSPPAANSPMVTAASSTMFFRRLFAGRPDVVPVRWENRKDRQVGLRTRMRQRVG